MAHLRAEISPKVLQWARARSRFDVATLAKRLNVSEKRYAEWESGDSQPTLKQLRKVAKVLRRPLGIFLLPEPPDEVEVLSELRRLPGAPPTISPELAEEVRIAAERRNTALELYSILDNDPPRFDFEVKVSDDPEKVGALARGLLGVTIDEQAAWNDSFSALRSWREAFQTLGVLVFQILGISMNEMRGFSVASRPLPIIAYNSWELVHGGIFTMMHEFAHILLGESVLDSAKAGSYQYSGNVEVEQFCNSVAAAILIPKYDLLALDLVKLRSNQGLWNDGDIQLLSRRYSVSKAVVLRRLLQFDLIDESLLEEYDESLLEEYDSYMRQPESRSGGNYYNVKIAWLGTLIPRLAFEAYDANRITSTDVATIIGVKVKNLGKFEEKLRGYNLYFPT